jgi:hypothetical protein
MSTRWQDSTAPLFRPARGSQPGAQAGRHAPEGQKNVGNRCCKSTRSGNPTLNPNRARNPLPNPNRNLNLYLFLPLSARHGLTRFRHFRLNPQKLQVVPTLQRPATHKPSRIWHFLALNGTVSEGLGFRKSIQERSYEILKNGQVHSRLGHSKVGHCDRRTAYGTAWARKQPILPTL